MTGNPYLGLGMVFVVSCLGSLLGALLVFRGKSLADKGKVGELTAALTRIEDSLAKERTNGVTAWDKSDWLVYYSACREFLLALGAKFVMLMTQASVYASAACAAMLALHHEFAGTNGTPAEIYVSLSGPLMLPLLVYWYFLVRYFYQTRETGSIMKGVEDTFTSVETNLRLLGRLRKVRLARIYGSRLTLFFVWVYPPLLAFAIFAIGYCLSYGLPNWILAKRI
jgi:hypothetical protein